MKSPGSKMDEINYTMEENPTPKSVLGSNTRLGLGTGPACLERHGRLRRLANEVERQMVICSKGELTPSDGTAILLGQMRLEYHTNLAEFANNLKSVTSSAPFTPFTSNGLQATV